MKKLWIIISVCWLWTCGGGGGGSSPTEPEEPAPVSNFTATPTILIQGQAVTFTSTSTGTITSYAWNVDDDPAIEGTTATYSHTYTEVGTYSITLTVTGPGGSNPKTVADMITVSTAAPTPTTETSQTVQEDGSTTISLTATDPNGQAVTFAITTDPTNGTATLSGTEITYTPNANFYGTDSFDYTASNGTYTSDPVTITITVEGEDDGDPTTNDVSATTDEDTVVTVNLDATEIDGDNYSFSIVTQPTNGTLGGVSGNQVEYTPNANWNGTDTFTFEATDDRTFRRNVATATITINPVNDAPEANDVTASMDENKIAGRYQPVTITLDATDVDGDALTYFKQSDPSNGTLGTITNNQVVYTPTQDFNGEDTFIYKATDGNADSNGATVTITINSINDAPVTQNVSFTTDEDTPYTESYTSYVSDVDGDNLTITAVTNPTNGTATCEGTDCTYTPNQDFNGTDSFTYKVNDGELDSNISTVSVTINPVNDAPIANDVTASTTSRTGNMRQSVDITLSVTDADGDDLTISIVSDVSNGTTSLSGSTVTYTPTANYDGTDTFTYKANDGTVDSNIATGTITITDTNQAPIANDMSFSLDREESINFALNTSDLDGDSLSKTTVTGPSNGTLLPGTGLNYTYTPDNEYFGTDSFTYKVNDGTNDSEVKTVSFDIDELIRTFSSVDIGYFASISENNNDNYYLYGDSGYIEFDKDLNLISSTNISGFIPLVNWSSAPYRFFRKFNDGYLSFYQRDPVSGCNGETICNTLIYYDSNMNVVHEKYLDHYNNGSLYDININYDNTILVSSAVANANNNGFIPRLIELDSSLNIISTTDFNSYATGPSNNEPFTFVTGAIKLSDGSYFLNIRRENRPNLVKLDQNKNIEWTINSSWEHFDQDASGNWATVNDIIEQDGKIIFPIRQQGMYAIDFNGNLQWNNGPYPSDDNFDLFVELSSGDFLYVSWRYLFKMNSSGSIIWSQNYGDQHWEQNYAGYIKDILEDADGNLQILLDVQENIPGVFKVDGSDGTKLLP